MFFLVQKENLDKFYEIYVKNLRNSYEGLINVIMDFKEFAIEKKGYKLKEEFQPLLKKENKKLPPPFFQQNKTFCQDFQNIAPDFFHSPRNSSK